MEILLLVKKAQNNDKDAMKQIIKRFTPTIYKQANSTHIIGYEFEDLIQIGYISVIKAVMKIVIKDEKNDEKKCVSYIKNAIVNNFFYEIRGKVKENYVSSLNKINGEGLEIMDILTDDLNIEEEYIKNDCILKLRTAIKMLSKDEQEIIRYFFIYPFRGAMVKYAEDKGIKYFAAINRKNSILKKLKNMLNIKIS